MKKNLPALLCVFCAACLILSGTASVSGQSIPNYFAKLNPTHPRILVSPQRQTEIEKMAQSDEFLQKLILDQTLAANALLGDKRIVEYKIVGPRLLSQSRSCLKKVLTLAGAYRLTADTDKKAQYKERAMKELKSAAAFKDWNPSHFLDTAEMTAAFAIGYDWLFSALSDEEKKLLVNAIYDKGLTPSLKSQWWWKSEYNWNQVCNSGMAMGALAIADALSPEKREVANEIVHRSVTTVPKAMNSFAPDGMWAEGPAYWEYTVLYTTFLINTLDASLGTDFGISQAPGFDKAADAQLAMAGASGLSYNFADAGSSFISCSMHNWLADRFNKPLYAEFERAAILEKTKNFKNLEGDKPRSTGKLYPTNVWYYSPKRATLADAPLDFYFRGAEIASMRSEWLNKDAWYIGFKAGGNAVNHSHLELGSFVLEKDAVRWAIDLGADNYNLPGYFGKLRWTYYRLSTRGQNTLVVDGQNQNPKAVAKIVKFQSNPDRCFASANLSEAYAGQLEFAARTITLDRKAGKVILEDKIGPVVNPQLKTVVWQMHTKAQFDMADDFRSVTMEQGGKTLKARIVAPEGKNVKFGVKLPDQTENEASNAGVAKLAVELPTTDKEQTLIIEFEDSADNLVQKP